MKRETQKTEEYLAAEYVSLWDDGLEVVTNCQVNLATGEVFPEVAEDTDDLDLEILEKEFIRLSDGTEFLITDEDDDYDYKVEDIEGLRAAISPTDLSPQP